MKVLMVGATGKVAGLLLPELLQRDMPVRALVRSDEKGQKAMRRGASEFVVGDLNDKKSLSAAVRGVDGVFHINPAFAVNEAGMGMAMVEAAQEGNVRKFVFSGVYHPSLGIINHAAKRPVEEALFHSCMDFTVLQPAIFMQNLSAAWPQVMETDQIAMPYSRSSKVCFVDYRDVAEVAAMAFVDKRLSNGCFELCSPGTIDRLQLAAMMSKAAGRTIEAADVAFDDWADSVRMPAGPQRDAMRAMCADYDRFGFSGGNSLVLETLLCRKPRSLEQFLRELAGRKVEAV